MDTTGQDEDARADAAVPSGELPVLTMMYDLAKWLLLRAEAFPRSLRFTLGDRIANTALEVACTAP